jgi:death-on-curing protein
MEEIGREIVYPSLEQICEINRRMIQEFGGLFVPPNNLLNPGALEYALEIIGADIYGETPYATLKEKASAIAYQIIAKHVFQDGNKRTAMHTAWEFLRSNGISVFLDLSVINISVGVATGETTQPQLLEWFHDHQKA